MSLTSHLGDRESPVRAFFRSQFANVDVVAEECRRDLSAVEMIEPPEAIPQAAYRLIGRAFDYRARYYFENYKSWDTVAFLGGIELMEYSMCDVPGGVDGPDSVYPLVWEFFGSAILGVGDNSEVGAVDSAVAELQPAGRRLEPQQERLLARHCFALAYFESVRRAGLQAHTPILRPTPVRSVAGLLALAEEPWVADLCVLSWAFHDEIAHLLTKQTKAVLNPIFDGSSDVGGADADLIVNGCLIDLKVVTRLDLASYLYQVLGYALLDYGDNYKIRDVGLYFARHRRMLSWPLTALVERVSGGNAPSVEQLRNEFRGVVTALPSVQK